MKTLIAEDIALFQMWPNLAALHQELLDSRISKAGRIDTDEGIALLAKREIYTTFARPPCFRGMDARTRDICGKAGWLSRNSSVIPADDCTSMNEQHARAIPGANESLAAST